MNNLRNSVQLIGNLGTDPEMKELPSGAKVTKARIATHESYKNNKGEFVETTTWHSIAGWDFVAERMMGQMRKGLEVVLHGKLVQRSYDDKNGIKRYVTEIKVLSFVMMDKEARKKKQATTADLDVTLEKGAVVPF